jgi:hypothetical protein
MSIVAIKLFEATASNPAVASIQRVDGTVKHIKLSEEAAVRVADWLLREFDCAWDGGFVTAWNRRGVPPVLFFKPT